MILDSGIIEALGKILSLCLCVHHKSHAYLPEIEPRSLWRDRRLMAQAAVERLIFECCKGSQQLIILRIIWYVDGKQICVKSGSMCIIH
jgi:hypothetical protein